MIAAISPWEILIRALTCLPRAPGRNDASVNWLSANGGSQSRIYSDQVSLFHLLYDYGRISFPRLEILSNSSIVNDGDYMYLRTVNVVDGIVGPSLSDSYNITEIAYLLGESNKVYANGLSEVFIYP